MVNNMGNIDFELILVVLTLTAGIVMLVDKLWWRKARLERLQAEAIVTSNQKKVHLQEHKPPLLVEYSRSFFPVLAIVLVLRSFLFEPYQIPSGSMLPTLEIGDFIIVNKYTYGVRLPVSGTKVIDMNTPKRGDVAVFKYPRNPSIKFIKRIIGVPGDHIMYKDKHLYINGEAVTKELLGMELNGDERYRESFSGNTHEIWQQPYKGRDFETGRSLGPSEYFVMGDNRDASNDSRAWGTVDDSLLVGKAVFVWMQWKSFLSIPNFSTAGSIE